VTEDTVFSSRTQAETFLMGIYEFGIHSNLSYAGSQEARQRPGYANPEGTMFTGASDESECTTDWYFVNLYWNNGSVNPNLGRDDVDGRFNYRWQAIRKVTVLDDRINDVPDMTEAEKEQFRAEAKVIRAMNYFEMLKRYGGVPIIDHRLNVDDNLKIPRSSVAEVVDFIVKDCDEALPYLAENYTESKGNANLKGRMHKGVALAVKSKTLLFAASPLFNTATPYLSFGEHNDLICYGDEKKDRWEAAAAAADACLKWAPAAGCHLITDKGADKNYEYTWNIYDNDEIILAEKSQVNTGVWIWPWGEFTLYCPPNKGYGGTSPTLNFVRKYEKHDGTLQNWPVYVDDKDTQIQEKMMELDYRFAQTIHYNMAYYNDDYKQAPLYQEAISTIESGENSRRGAITSCKGGFWLRKGRPTNINSKNYAPRPNSTIYQLNEIYMNFAEAMLEAYGPDSDPKGYGLTARQAINTLRARSGQPSISSGSGIYPDFRALVRNERAVELAFDNHRFWDIRRWMIAEEEGVMNGEMQGLKINLTNPEAPALPDKGYTGTVVKIEDRKFTRKMYLHPFLTDEVNIGYLVQNPGY
jgi:hypothetical protein